VTTLNVSDRLIVDSSGWVEYMGAGPKAASFATYLDSAATIFLPSIIVYEVHKKLYREAGKTAADIFVSKAFEFVERLIPLTLEISILASKASIENQLPIADAIIYATAHHLKAHLVTSDTHFCNLPDVTVL